MGAPAVQTMAAPAYTSAPSVTTMAAPTYTTAAPAVTTMAAPTVMGGYGMTEIDKVNAFGQVVERDFVGAAPTYAAAPTVMAAPTYTTAPAMTTMAAAPRVTEVDIVNACGQVVERDFIAAPAVRAPLANPNNLLAGGQG